MTSPIQYAEQTLGVHTVYQQGQDALAEIEGDLVMLSNAEERLRNAHRSVREREQQLFTDCTADPELAALSKTAFKEAVKTRTDADPSRRLLLDAIAEAEAERDQFKRKINYETARAQLASARLTELGGLLYFYGVAKQQQAQVTVGHVAQQPL